MAGNLPVPQGMEMKITYSLNGVMSALNILHFNHQLGETLNQGDADAMAATIRSAFTASLIPAQLHTSVALAKVEVRHMDQPSDPWFLGSGAAVAGTSVSDPLPAATALVVTLHTGLRGRSYKGRVYLWGWAENANSTTGTAATAATDAASAFISAIRTNMLSTHQYTLGVLSRWTTPPGSAPSAPPVERTPPIITPVIAVGAADARWDVQRRRAIPGI